MGDHLPTASIASLRRRAELLRFLRGFLESRGYWEVETPLLSHDVCVDAHLDPFVVPAAGREMYLQTSPEFGMKRLLAAGADAIYQVTRSFRADEVGVLHNPEFTIVEWYRVGGNYSDLMTEVGDLASHLAGWPAADRVTYRAAFLRWADLDVAEASDDALAARCGSLGFVEPAAERDDLLNFLLATLVEPNLGMERPTFLHDYPASQSALAVVRNDPFPVAERFELYYRGIELANGFQELTNADELRRRNVEQNAKRAARGMRTLPLESRLLAAMDAGLPASAGVALGFDRLAMLAMGETELAKAVAFTFDRS